MFDVEAAAEGMMRRSRTGIWLALAVVLAGCARPALRTAQPRKGPARGTAGTIFDAETAKTRAALARDVPRATLPAPAAAAAWIAATQGALARAGVSLTRPQLIVVVNRDHSVQRLCLVAAAPSESWRVVGCDAVSTGQSGRRGYYITPVGVFAHTTEILDYRALGTFNENHVRGLGLKGMRVWDFGWRVAEKGWRRDGETGEIRLLVHATDPDLLEPRLGHPASQGCVRISAAMNRFLDRHGVLDREQEAEARDNMRMAATLPADRTPSPLAGGLLVVIDSANAA
ncbi:MAG TPA: hypothetical protein PLX84_04115 [Acidiphilium sp.]|nr:hypothetical protein [Acidiphilium sp.]